MHSIKRYRILLLGVAAIALACDRSEPHGHAHPHPETSGQETGVAKSANTSMGGEHDHDEEPLGVVVVGDLRVEVAQAHGSIAPGKELHLVIKLPYSDQGQTVVRGWLGSEDRAQHLVARAEYAPAHDDYDLHALAPDEVTEGTLWWIEVQRPGQASAVGSIAPK